MVRLSPSSTPSTPRRATCVVPWVLAVLLTLLVGQAWGLPPELPRVFLDTTLVPPTGQTIAVAAGGDFQAALNAAQPGDVITLQAGATFTGPFTLPNKTGTGWIIVRTSAPDSSLPPLGTRVGPSYAAVMPKIVVGANMGGAIQTAPGAHHFRFIGIEVKPVSGAMTFGLVELGSWSDTSTTTQPHDIIIDRCYIHGNPGEAAVRGVALNGSRLAVIDSYLADFKDQGFDTQALMGWNGPGPFKIVNNYLEAAGENVMFGGADPSIVNLVPSDIEIRRNYFHKPTSWRGVWADVKNLFELKNARRVLVEGNIFENTWLAAQDGYAILFTVRNQDGTAPWSTIEDVTFQKNIIRHAGTALDILTADDPNVSQNMKRVLIRDNLFDDISAVRWGGFGRFISFLGYAGGAVDVVIEHNTAFYEEDIVYVDGIAHTGFIFRNNITPRPAAGFGFIGGGTLEGLPTLTVYFPLAVFTRNVLAGANALIYPIDNFFPPSLDAVGFVDRVAGNYRLAPSSPYKNAATDGTDIGADIDALDAATAGVLTGSPSAQTSTLAVIRAGTGSGTVTSAPAGINCGTGCSASYPSGTAVTLSATPAAGSTFAGWSGGGCAGTAPCTLTLSANTAVTATFNLPSVTLAVIRAGTGSGTVTSAPAGINCGTSCSAPYPSGTAVTLSATPAAGSTFAGWSGGGCTGTGSCTVTLTATTTVTATFTQTFTLTVSKAGTGSGTVSSTPAGITCGTSCSASYASGTSVTLSAAPANGSTFTGWSGGGCSGTGSCNVTLTIATTVTATFNVSPNVSPASLTLSFNGKLRDKVGQGETALSPDGRLDGTFTVSLAAGSGARTVTRLDLQRSGGGHWDTVPGNSFWVLGAAPSLDGALLNSANGAVSFAVTDGGSFILFASDINNTLFTAGTAFTLTASFADGSSSTASLTVAPPPPPSPGPPLTLAFNGKLRDKVGQGETALSPDGRLDGTFTVSLAAGSGARTVTRLDLQRSGGGHWDTVPGNSFWVLGAAPSLDGALLNSANGAVSFAVTDGGSFILFASDINNTLFTAGTAFTLAASFADGSSSTASLTVAPPPPPSRSPYKGVPSPVPGLIEAEDFDTGGEGISWHDLTPGNQGGFYRLNTDVDIIAPTGNASGAVVNNFQTGEWFEYTISVAQTGTYRLEVHASSEFSTSRWHAEIDRVNVTGSVAVPNTGWWGTFQWVGIDGIFLTAGQHVLRIHADQEYFNLNALRVVAQSGLLAAYSFNQGSGGTALDASGNGNHGTILGATWTSLGKYGNVLSFNGVDARVRASNVTLGAAFTIMAWVYNPTNAAYETIVTVETNRDFYLSNGVISFYDGLAERLFGSAISTNVWHHVAIVSDGSTLRVYLDGAPSGTPQAVSLGSVTGALQVGAWMLGSDNYDFFGGRIDEVRVYTRALTQAEVQADMKTPIAS